MTAPTKVRLTQQLQEVAAVDLPGEAEAPAAALVVSGQVVDGSTVFLPIKGQVSIPSATSAIVAALDRLTAAFQASAIGGTVSIDDSTLPTLVDFLGGPIVEVQDLAEAAEAVAGTVVYVTGILGELTAYAPVTPVVDGDDLVVDIGSDGRIGYVIAADTTPTIDMLRIVLPSLSPSRAVTLDFAGLAATPASVQIEDETNALITPAWRGTPATAADYAAGVRLQAVSDGTDWSLVQVGS